MHRFAAASLASLAGVAIVTGGVLAAPVTSSATTLRTVPGTQVSWANAAHHPQPLPARANVRFDVWLTGRYAGVARKLAYAVSNPNSASYHHFLTPGRYRARFAPSVATERVVRSWLRAEGFAVRSAPSNRAYLAAEGNAGQVEVAFATRLATYRVGGMRLRAAATALRLPTAVAPHVRAVTGVTQSVAKPDVVPPEPGYRNAPPCSAYYGQKIDTTDPPLLGQQRPYVPCGYVPSQLRSAYGLTALGQQGYTGRGQTVAVVDAYGSPLGYSDAAQYARRNDPANPLTAGQYSETVAPPTPGTEGDDVCGAASWYGEEDLDIEAVHAMAPGANIHYVGAADCYEAELDAAINSVVAKRSADVITNSWGIPELYDSDADASALTQIAVQAALEGITLAFSSGDDGDEAAAYGVVQSDFPASDPWVTAVGGTTTAIGANGRRLFDTGWETDGYDLDGSTWVDDGFYYGSGGGTSTRFAEPIYQVGTVPAALARQNQTGNRLGRVVPDISLDGDVNTGMLEGETQTFPDGVYYDQYRVGGTSLSSPLFAGLMAVSNQLDRFDHGFVNPLMYLSARLGVIDDVQHVGGAQARVEYNNGVDATDGTYVEGRDFDDTSSLAIHTTKGYDNVTGLGTPDGASFLLLP